jgi:pantoate kinase
LLKASAFVPGHVTGFFEIHDEAEEINKRGSRGAGICLSKGARTTVEIKESEEQRIEVEINQNKDKAPVTTYAVKKIIGDRPVEVTVKTGLELPSGQGFGMSGAGALSAVLAASNALELGISMEQIVCAAHEAEIICASGLGDVMPQSIGGIVVRKKEGCHPHGIVENIAYKDEEIVLCIIGEELSTKEIITDPNYRTRINDFGKECLNQLITNPDIKKLMYLSSAFSKGTGLLSWGVEEAMSAVRRLGIASMSMLGNSLFAVGDTENLAASLKNFGEVFVCSIDREGARIVNCK